MSHELDDWKTKAEAAEILGCSEKTVERYAKQSRIQKFLRRNPGRKAMPVFHPGDIETLRSEAVRLEPFPVEKQFPRSRDDVAHGPGAGEQALALPARQSAVEMLVNLLADRVSPPATAARHKLFLTLAEAADYSGMSQGWLRQKIRQGELPAIKTRGWKIRRGDLEQL